MSSLDIKIDTPSLVKHVLLKVTLKRHNQAMLRVRLAAALIRFAALVGGFGGIVVDDEQLRKDKR